MIFVNYTQNDLADEWSTQVPGNDNNRVGLAGDSTPILSRLANAAGPALIRSDATQSKQRMPACGSPHQGKYQGNY